MTKPGCMARVAKAIESYFSCDCQSDEPSIFAVILFDSSDAK